jgi:hypothetical protein
MTQPTIYLWRMVIFLAAVGGIAAMLAPDLLHAFQANPLLNGVILAVLLFGIGMTFSQVLSLRREVAWVDGFRTPKDGLSARQPSLLAPMVSMLSGRRNERVSLSASAMRSVLDGLQSRLDERRELSRYVTGLLIFLGLLGTFWGLLLTIASIADVIGNMSVGSGDLNVLFEQLKTGLAKPLQGMGTAFSASMLGLAGALVEEWLAGLTRLSSGILGQEGEGSVPAYVQALLEQTAENLETLQSTIARGEDGRAATSQALMTLTERMTVLTEQMRANNTLMRRIADAQDGLAPAISRLAESQADRGEAEAMRGHLRNLEIYLARLVEEVAQGRAQSTNDIRNEIKILTRTIAAIAEEQPR